MEPMGKVWAGIIWAILSVMLWGSVIASLYATEALFILNNQ